MHTTSAAGSYSRLNCRCTPGYSCTYYKRIQAIVTLNATVSDFNNDVGGIKTAFIAGMAAAANVTTNFVTINGVIARNNLVTGGGSRRLLSLPAARKSSLKAAAEERASELSIQEEFEQMPKLHEEQKMRRSMNLAVHGDPYKDEPDTIRVFATVAGAGRLNHLEHRLERHAPGLHIANRWERHQSIKASKAE